MLTADQINAIHRLHWAEHWSARKIAGICISAPHAGKYLETPAPRTATRQRASKLDRLSQPRRMVHPGPDRQRRGDRATARPSVRRGRAS